MLFGTWVEKWFKLYGMTKKPNTRNCYARSIRAMPAYITQMEITSEELPEVIREWQLQRSSSAPRAAQLDRIMIIQVLRMASAYGYITMRDWAMIFPRINHKPAETAYLDHEQLRLYIQTIMQRADPATPGLLLMAAAGLRRGEALGARWSDLAGDVLTISSQRIAGELCEPKSSAGRRSIQLTGWIVDELRSYETESEFICPVSQKRLYRAHYTAIEAAGLHHVTLHGLRHSAAMAYVDQMPLKALQRLLGHAKISLTADLYGGHRQQAHLPSTDRPPRGTRLEIV